MPLLNASLTDCVFEVKRETTVQEVNALFKAASEGALQGILGFEVRPLVSIDFKDDPLGHRRRPFHDGHRQDAGQSTGLVRQRVGICESHGGTDGMVGATLERA